jgi:hypothetical protein
MKNLAMKKIQLGIFALIIGAHSLAYGASLKSLDKDKNVISSVDTLSWNESFENPKVLMETVQLNHIYLVVDKETYESIKRSELIKSLVCAYEQKNSADNQVAWEGLYIRGKDTYVEFFYPQERYPKIGISGIGMGIDSKGGLDAILERMKEDHPKMTKGWFRHNGKPWFEYIAVNDSYFFESNSYWIMEYASEHFSVNPNNVSRAHYNEKKYDPIKPFLNIEGFSIALKPEGLEILSSYLKSSGLNAHDHIYSTSENVGIELSEEDETHKGIYQINFSLNQYFQDGSHRIGNSILILEGKKGIWTFFANGDEQRM